MEMIGSMEDAQSVVGFHGQLCYYVVNPGEVMADVEAEEFKRQSLPVHDDGNR